MVTLQDLYYFHGAHSLALLYSSSYLPPSLISSSLISLNVSQSLVSFSLFWSFSFAFFLLSLWYIFLEHLMSQFCLPFLLPFISPSYLSGLNVCQSFYVPSVLFIFLLHTLFPVSYCLPFPAFSFGDEAIFSGQMCYKFCSFWLLFSSCLPRTDDSFIFISSTSSF